MKKIFTLVASLLVAGSAVAEGYQVNLQSARQAGMGHVGAGMKLGAESMHFNPAGLTSIEGLADISIAGSMVVSRVQYTNGNYTHRSKTGLSTPLGGYAGFKINDRWAAGIAVTTPYGSSLEWGEKWAGAHHVQDISLTAFSYQPTVAFKILPNLSVGAGLNIYSGHFELNKAVLPVGYKPGIPQFDPAFPADAPAASVNMSGSSNIAMGFNLGLMWDVRENVTLGVSYRSKATLKVKDGESSVSYASPALGTILPAVQPSLSTIDGGSVSTQLPAPSNLTLGASYRINERWMVATDLQYVGWAAYDSLNFTFKKEDKVAEVNSEKGYSNSIAARFGAEFVVSKMMLLRAGYYFDQTPVNAMHYSPETPGANKHAFTFGGTLNLFKGFDLHGAAAYVFGKTNDAKIEDSMVAGGNFTGSYRPRALNLSIGVQYKF